MTGQSAIAIVQLVAQFVGQTLHVLRGFTQLFSKHDKYYSHNLCAILLHLLVNSRHGNLGAWFHSHFESVRKFNILVSFCILITIQCLMCICWIQQHSQNSEFYWSNKSLFKEVLKLELL